MWSYGERNPRRFSLDACTADMYLGDVRHVLGRRLTIEGYRALAMPSLRGTYLYSDYCSGVFRSLRRQEGVAGARRDLTRTLNPNGLTTISSFGQDNNGALGVMTHSSGPFNLRRDGGAVYRIVPAEEATTASPSEPPAPDTADAGASLDAGEGFGCREDARVCGGRANVS